ncbi:hypothetical protein QFZ20_000266 [Flavobacterium sp. W4I14]|nr:hypothetical protein [Flavobacterium sp. W4I14]
MDTARELLLNSDIEATDYRIIKDQCNEKITRLEARLSDLNAENHAILDIKPIAEEAMNSLRLWDEFYEKADVEGKRYLVGMLYPEKLTFDGGMCRTPSMNLAAELIYQKNKELQIKKMGRKSLKETFVPFGGQ